MRFSLAWPPVVCEKEGHLDSILNDSNDKTNNNDNNYNDIIIMMMMMMMIHIM